MYANTSLSSIISLFYLKIKTVVFIREHLVMEQVWYFKEVTKSTLKICSMYFNCILKKKGSGSNLTSNTTPDIVLLCSDCVES